jgi:hypothetical protein
MYFAELQSSLLESLKARVRNGQLTERGLARLVGVSQPHMHNVLKGARFLSPDLADQILQRLHISIFDLVDRTRLTNYLNSQRPLMSECTYVPVLNGTLGPGHLWPSAVDAHKRFAVPTVQLVNATGAVVVRLGSDTRMDEVVHEGDFALLDQSLHARCAIEPDALYVVKRGNAGFVRRLRTSGRNVFIAADDCLSQPAAWERISLEAQYIQHVVRAKATLLAQDTNWLDGS